MRSSLALRCFKRATALHTLIHQCHPTLSCGALPLPRREPWTRQGCLKESLLANPELEAAMEPLLAREMLAIHDLSRYCFTERLRFPATLCGSTQDLVEAFRGLGLLSCSVNTVDADQTRCSRPTANLGRNPLRRCLVRRSWSDRRHIDAAIVSVASADHPAAFTPSITYCTASAASNTPSRRESTILPVTPRNRAMCVAK